MKKFLILLLIAAASISSFAQAKKIVADKILGVVGSRIILQSDIHNAIADISRNGGTVPENAECSILDQAITQKVLAMQADKDSLTVTDAEVEAELEQRVRYFINVYGTQQAVEDMAGKTIYQIKDEARESVKERKLAEAMQHKIVDNVKVTPNEVKQFFEKIPKDSLPYFESELEVGQIILYPKATRDMDQYVISELNNYKRQIEAKVATFEQLAKRYSEDPGSKDRGGQYQINRNDKTWDPSFKSAAFRLKDGEISNIVKTKFGYHIIQMVERQGDEAIIRHILRIPPVTDDEIQAAVSKLDSVRQQLIAGKMDFNTAAGKYNEDEAAKFAGSYLTGRTGESSVTIDELDKDIVAMLDKIKVGEYSPATAFTDEKTGKKGVRMIYLKSKSQPHRMNMTDDYNRIAQQALEDKKYKALEKWMATHSSNYYIQIDSQVEKCPVLKKWAVASNTAGIF
ncbi:MAG: peptidylprolyl isomerase [Candidatus Dadabacteria bacterium]